VTRPTAYGEPIVTGEAVAVELRPAGVGSRGIAVAVDFTIQLVLTLLLLWFVAAVVSSVESAAGAAVFLVVFVGILLGYPVGFETLWRGRTPGKAVMGVRVVRDDGGPIRFRHAFVRGLVGVVLDRLGLSVGLLALVPMLSTARSKRLGDLAAGTFVVQDRVPTRAAAPPPMPPGLESWARSLDLGQVTDELATELRFFLSRSAQLAPPTRDEMGNRLYATLRDRTAPPPPAGLPAWVFLSAVLAERRRREVERLDPGRPTPATQPPAPSPLPRDAGSAAAGPQPPEPPSPGSPPPGPFAPPR
jgi:uncharacterized RDD family membrane protein YckC